MLRAVILAACVAGAIAGAPSEEWAERLRLLETRVEQVQKQSEQREAALNKRVAFLEGEVQRLRPSSEQAEATAPKARTGKAAVGPMGEPEAVGRRLSPAPTCCRWTADGTCGTVPAERFEVCTHMHECLETKTTTHEFADLDTCLGPDASKWSAKFDGASSDVTLSYDAAVMATLKTPLKVTHAASCGNDPPTLNVQMDTVHDGSLTLGGNTVHSSPKLLYQYEDTNDPTSSILAWTNTATSGLSYTATLAETSTLLVHYKVTGFIDNHGGDGTYLVCRLHVDGTEQPGARSISGSGYYASTSGTWIGVVQAGSPVIFVDCLSSGGGVGLTVDETYEVKALTVAILG